MQRPKLSLSLYTSPTFKAGREREKDDVRGFQAVQNLTLLISSGSVGWWAKRHFGLQSVWLVSVINYLVASSWNTSSGVNILANLASVRVGRCEPMFQAGQVDEGHRSSTFTRRNQGLSHGYRTVGRTR